MTCTKSTSAGPMPAVRSMSLTTKPATRLLAGFVLSMLIGPDGPAMAGASLVPLIAKLKRPGVVAVPWAKDVVSFDCQSPSLTTYSKKSATVSEPSCTYWMRPASRSAWVNTDPAPRTCPLSRIVPFWDAVVMRYWRWSVALSLSEYDRYAPLPGATGAPLPVTPANPPVYDAAPWMTIDSPSPSTPSRLPAKVGASLTGTTVMFTVTGAPALGWLVGLPTGNPAPVTPWSSSGRSTKLSA